MLINAFLEDETCHSDILDDAVISFDQIGFLPLSFIVLCGWFILNKFYNNVVKILLCQLSIRDAEVRRLQTVYWNISFTTITIPFALQALSISFEEVPDKFYFNLDKNIIQWFSQESVNSRVKLIYILLTGFFLNKVCQISIEKGFKNIDFIVSELFAVFFVSTFAYRCIRFGLAFMVVYNAVQCLLEFTRMLYCFSKIYPSHFSSVMTKVLFLLHVLLWIVVFLHIVPTYFLLTTLNSVISSFDDASHVLILMLLNTALWSFYLLHITSSPLTTCIVSLLLQKPCSFEVLLFDYSYTSVKTPDMGSPQNSNLNKNVSHNENSDEIQNKQKSRENLSKVYQTVKCYIRLKRKLKRIRTKLKDSKTNQEDNTNTSQNPTESSKINSVETLDQNINETNIYEEIKDFEENIELYGHLTKV